jgi:cation transport ATPase
MTEQAKDIKAYVSDDAILHVFATATGEPPHPLAPSIVPAARSPQEQYMLNVGRGLLALQRSNLALAQPLTAEEFKVAIKDADFVNPWNARELAIVGGAIMRALMRKWGLR